MSTAMNDLPADFDTFSEQHRKNFLRIRALSRENPIVGTFCTFVPRELIRAAGAVPVSLCGGTDLSGQFLPAGEVQLRIASERPLLLLAFCKTYRGRNNLRRQEKDV